VINCWLYKANNIDSNCTKYCFRPEVGVVEWGSWQHRKNAENRTGEKYKPCLYQSDEEFRIAVSMWRLSGGT